MDISYTDVAIIGGSFAGLSAALLLGNARRSVTLIDDGNPRNQASSRIHNLLGHESIAPIDFLTNARRELRGLNTVTILNSTAKAITKKDKQHFSITLENNMQLVSNKIILATGVVDILPEIAGIKDFWIKNIFNCPYCFGCEVNDEPLSIYSTEEEAYLLALLIQKWSKDLILLTNGQPFISKVQSQHLQELAIEINPKIITHFSGEPGKHIEINFNDGSKIKRRGIFMHLRIEQQAKELITSIGCELTEDNLIKVNESYQTNISGIYAIGDAALKFQKVAVAMASGTTAAIIVDHELALESGYF